MESTIAYRRLVYTFSQLLTWDERRGLIYMRLYKDREKYKNADTLKVLSRLEEDEVFTSANPAGLLAIANDVKRPDLAKKVKQLMKTMERPKPTESGTGIEMETGVLRDQVVEILSLVTILTEQCSQGNYFVHGYTELRKRREIAHARMGDAVKTVSKLSQVLQRVNRELESCQVALVAPQHRSAVGE